MEVRQNVRKKVLLKCATVAGINFLMVGIERGVLAYLKLNSDQLAFQILSHSCPLTTLTVLVATGVIFKYGSQILVSLYGAHRSRQAIKAEANSEYNFFAIAVAAMMWFQLLKLVLHVAKIAVSSFIAKSSDDCLEIQEAIGLLKCFNEAKDLATRGLIFVKETWSYLVEFIFIIVLIVRKIVLNSKGK